MCDFMWTTEAHISANHIQKYCFLNKGWVSVLQAIHEYEGSVKTQQQTSSHEYSQLHGQYIG